MLRWKNPMPRPLTANPVPPALATLVTSQFPRGEPAVLSTFNNKFSETLTFIPHHQFLLTLPLYPPFSTYTPFIRYESPAAIARHEVEGGCRALHQSCDPGMHFSTPLGGCFLTTIGGRAFSRYPIQAIVYGIAKGGRHPNYLKTSSNSNFKAAVPSCRPSHHRALLPCYRQSPRDQGSLHCRILRGIRFPAVYQQHFQCLSSTHCQVPSRIPGFGHRGRSIPFPRCDTEGKA